MHSLLQNAQAQIYAILSGFSPCGFFLRCSQDDQFLWSSDFPRRTEHAAMENAIAALQAQGMVCRLSLPSQMLHIDYSLSKYEGLTALFPTTPPALPSHDELHPAYALCRLLLTHPASLESQPLIPLRKVLKASNAADSAVLLRMLPGLHEQCAQWLREGKPLPYAAGQAIARWLALYTETP